MATHYVSVKISPTEYKHFKVDEPVLKYIKQLEYALLEGDTGRERMAKLYPKFIK